MIEGRKEERKKEISTILFCLLLDNSINDELSFVIIAITTKSKIFKISAFPSFPKYNMESQKNWHIKNLIAVL